MPYTTETGYRKKTDGKYEIYLAETKTCISGDISDYLPLSRSTVSQHLNELKELGLIHGQIDGLKVNYCLCSSIILKYKDMVDSFFKEISTADVECSIDGK